MPILDGSRVISGVKWSYDKNTISVVMALASCGKYTGKRVKSTWKNECPYCKSKGWNYKGNLYPHGAKGRKTATEGEISCKRCDTDFDGVSGKSKEGRCKYSLTKALAPSPVTSSSTTSTTLVISQNDKKKALKEIKKNTTKEILLKKRINYPPLHFKKQMRELIQS